MPTSFPVFSYRKNQRHIPGYEIDQEDHLIYSTRNMIHGCSRQVTLNIIKTERKQLVNTYFQVKVAEVLQSLR